MKYVKKFNEVNGEYINNTEFTNEEFFGGKSGDVLLPKLDNIVDKLSDIRKKITDEFEDSDTRKVEVIYNYLILDMDLDMLSTQKRKSDELTSTKSKENVMDKLKRTRRNW